MFERRRQSVSSSGSEAPRAAVSLKESIDEATARDSICSAPVFSSLGGIPGASGGSLGVAPRGRKLLRLA